jgi:hypothetical protein
MKVVTYTASVDPDVKFPNKEFVDLIEIYLSDPNGWEGHGYRFKRVARNPEVVIRLSTPASLRKIGCDDYLSCAELGGRQMWLNSLRWLQGARASQHDLDNYRQYMVSHEIGHILGYDHVKCPGIGENAPVMLQQTLGLRGCTPNLDITEWDKRTKVA